MSMENIETTDKSNIKPEAEINSKDNVVEQNNADTEDMASEYQPDTEINTDKDSGFLDKIVDKWNSLSKKQKLAVYTLVLGFGLSGSFVLGGVLKNDKNSIQSTKPVAALDEVSTEYSSFEDEVKKLPKEGRDFVAQYGDTYDDPISTYYAKKGYETNANQFGIVLTDDFINSFEISHLTHGDESVLGFTAYELPLSVENNQETAVNVFNTYTAKNLSNYMNYIAKNPSEEALAIIDSEFQNYCSDTGSDNQENTAFLFDNEPVKKLMDTAKDIVAKYGSAANYSVAPAAIDTSDPNMTNFPISLCAVTNRDYRGEDITTLHSCGVTMVVNVDTYDGNIATQKKETLKDKQLSIIRQPFMDHTGYTYISIGQER